MQHLDSDIFHRLQQNARLQQDDSTKAEQIFYLDEASLFAAYESSPFQSPITAQNIFFARTVAAQLLSEQGTLENTRIVACIQNFSKYVYPVSTNRHQSTPGRQHILKMLKMLQTSAFMRDTINHLFVPSYPALQAIIRETLALSPSAPVQEHHVRQAVLAALFTYLRQDVGSCFATSLAIIIHREQPERFIKDLADLLAFGKLTRIAGDREIVTPMNLFPCIGELFQPIEILDLYPHPLLQIAKSPGIQQAFVATGILSDVEPVETQIQQLLSHEFLLQKTQQTNDRITANELLQTTLMHYFQVSKQEVAHVLLHEGIQNKEKILESPNTHQFSPRQKVYHYLEAYEQARKGFIANTQNRLLKCWEYTLATLADARQSSTAQHLQTSLGMRDQGPYGLQAILQEYFDNAIRLTQEAISKAERTYEEAKVQLDYVSRRAAHAMSEQEQRVLSMDRIRFQQELTQARNEWETLQSKIKQLVTCPSFLITFYQKTLPSFFKSCYDPLIQEFTDALADTPSGFRVLYTHGRSHPHTWTPIYSINEYVQALSNFFSSTEPDLLERRQAKGIEKELSACIQQIIASFHSSAFQAAALNRILKAHAQPENPSILNHLDTVAHTPWAYVSGGTVSTLITDYFENHQDNVCITKHAEHAHELAAFLSDALKDLPVPIKQYLEADHYLIISSPTHTFSIQANSPLFRDAWDNDWYSYTWLRDVWMQKQQKFLRTTTYSAQEVSAFINIFCTTNHLLQIKDEWLAFCSDLSFSLPEFYNQSSKFFQQAFPNSPALISFLEKHVASALVQLSPFSSEQQLPTVIESISQYLGIPSRITFEKFAHLIEQYVPKFSMLSALDLRRIYSGLLMESYQRTYTEEDLCAQLAAATRSLGFSYPAPLLFGDTNWTNAYFGFIVHPGTQGIEIWQFDYLGLNGRPVGNSHQLLSLQHPWVLFPNPTDYGMPPFRPTY